MVEQCKNDFTKPDKIFNEVRHNLETLVCQLQSELITNPRDEARHKAKMKAALIDLEIADRKLLDTYNALVCEEEDDLESNFGVSLKLEMANNTLSSLKQKHSSLRKEWYSQDEHLRKMSKKICDKDKELKSQKDMCITQGLLFSKILWKFTKSNNLLETILTHENLVLDIIKIHSSSLRKLTNETLNCESEYQYILCLTGIINNFATIPDGRFFLISQPVCQNAINQIIRSIPHIEVTQGEDLKFLLLSVLYNVMICKEGENFICNNCSLIYSLTNCVSSQSDRIILLSLKIMRTLTSTERDSRGGFINEIPIDMLKTFRHHESSAVSKEASEILESVSHFKKKCCTKAKTVRKISKLQFSDARRECPNNVLAYYLFTNTNLPHPSSNTGTTTVTETSMSASSSISTVRRSTSFPSSRSSDKSDFKSRWSETMITEMQLPGEDKSTSMGHVIGNLQGINETISDEIQSMQYGFPDTNLKSTFSVTIGDHLQISIPDGNITMLQGTCCIGGDIQNTSIVTVYRRDDTQSIALSDNTFLPFMAMTCNDASMAIEGLKSTKELMDIQMLKSDTENLPSTSTSTDMPKRSRCLRLNCKKKICKFIAKKSYFKRKKAFKKKKRENL